MWPGFSEGAAAGIDPNNRDVTLEDGSRVLSIPVIFGLPEFAEVFPGVARRYGITVHLNSEVTEVPGHPHGVVINRETDTTTNRPSR